MRAITPKKNDNETTTFDKNDDRTALEARQDHEEGQGKGDGHKTAWRPFCEPSHARCARFQRSGTRKNPVNGSNGGGKFKPCF